MRRTGKVLAGPGRPYDLIVVCAVVAVAALLPAYFPTSPVMWVLGFAAVFFCPGYALTAALLPGRREILAQSFMFRREERAFNISLLERLALSVGLSATSVALVATVMTRGLLVLNSTTVGVVLIAITFVAAALAVYRRSQLPPGDQFLLTLPELELGRLNSAERMVAAIIMVSVVVLGAVGVSALRSEDPGMPFSDFAISGADGRLDHLPSTLTTGQQGLFRVNATNHLGEEADYTIRISLGQVSTFVPFNPAQPVALSPGQGRSVEFSLQDGESFERVITFSISQPGQWTVLLELHSSHGEVRTLWLPITVR